MSQDIKEITQTKNSVTQCLSSDWYGCLSGSKVTHSVHQSEWLTIDK